MQFLQQLEAWYIWRAVLLLLAVSIVQFSIRPTVIDVLSMGWYVNKSPLPVINTILTHPSQNHLSVSGSATSPQSAS